MSNTFGRRPGTAIDDETKQTYIALWLLKKLDLTPEDGGMELPVSLPAELSPLDETLQQLAVDDLIRINVKTGRYALTKSEEAIAELRARGLDVFRARFIWGWFDGEFDDMVQWQEQRGIRPVERLWAFYLTGDDFWNELARELDGEQA